MHTGALECYGGTAPLPSWEGLVSKNKPAASKHQDSLKKANQITEPYSEQAPVWVSLPSYRRPVLGNWRGRF